MDSINLAQGRKVPVMAVALAMALVVNGAFALALHGASTDGQRMYDEWFAHGNQSTMVAEAVHKVPAKS